MRRGQFISVLAEVAMGLAMAGLAACGATPSADGEDAAIDAGVLDTQARDAAPPVDAAPPLDAGYSTALPGCDDAAALLYQTPTDLPPLTDALRGTIVRCSVGALLTAAAVQAAGEASGATFVATSGVRVVKLAYRTVRGDGAATVTTATVYLPTTPRALPVPVMLAARSTAGLADRCAPSRDELPAANQALPFAGLGYAVVSPDFSGLGNEGVHAYLDNREAVQQLFDGARALEGLVGAGLIGAPTVALGYSQGGGIVLSAQALEQELTGRRSLRAVVAIAPEWPTRANSFKYVDVLRNPDQLTGTTGLAPPTVVAMRQYGWFTNHLGPAHAGDSFPAGDRASILSSVESLCTIPLGAALGANQPRVRDLVDDSFRVAMLACVDGGPGCVEPAAGFYGWLEDNVVHADPAGAPILIIAGLADQVMPAASEAACDVAKLRAEGVTPEVCSDPLATHDTVLERKIEHAIAWAEAAATGQAHPSCSSSFLPTCTP